MEKIKLFIESEKGKDILIVIIVILVGLASFELGRLSKGDLNDGLKIDYTGQKASAISSLDTNTANIAQITNKSDNSNNQGNYFASKKGTKFYSITCSAGKTIKQENKIYFSSADAAISAGYELSSACR
jgi:hypothetical protein